ncbi:MAG: hypothetical protein ABIK90_04050 [candidate division WOR-3 bacterium]
MAIYGILNTKNFQQLLDEAKINPALKQEIINLARENLYTLFKKYFDLGVADNYLSTYLPTVTPLWGNFLATALENNWNIIADFPDPSKWEMGLERVRVRLTGDVAHTPDCKWYVRVDLEIEIE